MKGCTFPGRMISSAGAVRSGETTETAGTPLAPFPHPGRCGPSHGTRCPISRARRPRTRTTPGQPVFRALPLPPRSQGEFARRFAIFSLRSIGTPQSFALFCFGSAGAAGALQNAEKRRNKEQRRNGREKQSTNNCPAKGRILFAAVAQPRAMGTMPIIMASAVISTGRKRVNPASSAALMNPFLPSFFRWQNSPPGCCWRLRRPCT